MTGIPRLATCSYSEYRRDMGTAVRISLGVPRFVSLPDPRYSRYSRWPYLDEATPRRTYLKSPREVYEPQYLAQLDRLADEIARKLTWIEPEHGALCLLCFESDLTSQWCHRRIFADWWQARTGQAVTELGGKRTARR